MGKRCTLVDAAKITGLSQWELRTGALSGKYSCFRIGGSHGKFIFDIDLLEARIEELMKRNIKETEMQEADMASGIRRVY